MRINKIQTSSNEIYYILDNLVMNAPTVFNINDGTIGLPRIPQDTIRIGQLEAIETIVNMRSGVNGVIKLRNIITSNEKEINTPGFRVKGYIGFNGLVLHERSYRLYIAVLNEQLNIATKYINTHGYQDGLIRYYKRGINKNMTTALEVLENIPPTAVAAGLYVIYKLLPSMQEFILANPAPIENNLRILQNFNITDNQLGNFYNSLIPPKPVLENIWKVYGVSNQAKKFILSR